MKDTIWIKKGRFTPLAVVLMFAFPLVTALICLCFGRMNVPVGEVLTALRTALTGGSTSNVQNYSIVINLRLPRILTAIIVGAGLSCAGNTYQSLFSNPLATPDILGVTSGTCVGAILAIILSCSILETQLIALVFGLISVCTVGILALINTVYQFLCSPRAVDVVVQVNDVMTRFIAVRILSDKAADV